MDFGVPGGLSGRRGENCHVERFFGSLLRNASKNPEAERPGLPEEEFFRHSAGSFRDRFRAHREAGVEHFRQHRQARAAGGRAPQQLFGASPILLGVFPCDIELDQRETQSFESLSTAAASVSSFLQKAKRT